MILTVICGLSSVLFLAGGLFGILPAAFSIFCGIYLWTAESRQWFAIKNGKMEAPVVVRPDPFSVPVAPPAPVVPVAQTAIVKAPRPQPVLASGLIALIMSALVAFVSGGNALFYIAAKSEYIRILSDNPFMKDTVRQIGTTPTELARAMFIGCSIAVVLSLFAVAAAGATLARSRIGRILLIVLTFITVPVSVAAFPLGLVWTAGAIATLVLLRRPESRAWFDKS
ncbi:MAG: hypothetical protein ABIR57_04845 [Aeromicrobium sp.]